MIPLPLSPKLIQKDKTKAIFEIESLYPGYGVTIGNALRRVLLSSLPGAAATQVKIKGVPHELSTIPGVLEDVTQILLNLKQLRFKIYTEEPQKASLKIKGEKDVKGSDFNLPSQVELINKDLKIATLTTKSAELEIEIQIEKGLGYVTAEKRAVPGKEKPEIGAIALDAVYTPIKRVSFKVENMRVGERTDFDRIKLEIETDGAIDPEDAFLRASEILVDHFSLIRDGLKKEEKSKAEAAKTEKGSEAKGNDAVEETKVEDLKISTRTINALSNGNIKTVSGILRKNEKSLLELEGMGEKGLKEIKKALKKLGLEMKEE